MLWEYSKVKTSNMKTEEQTDLWLETWNLRLVGVADIHVLVQQDLSNPTPVCNPFLWVIQQWFSFPFDHLSYVFAPFNTTLCLFRCKNVSPRAVWLDKFHCISYTCISCDEECRYLISAKYSLVSSLHGWHFVASEIQE